MMFVDCHVTAGVLVFWKRNFTRQLAEVRDKADCYGQAMDKQYGTI